MVTTIILFGTSFCACPAQSRYFFVARRMGMKVEEFGFGFPPRLFSWSRNGTTYSINWIPLGGFVKVKGESGDCKNEADSYAGKSRRARAAVLLAGVTMNIVLAAVLLSVGFTFGLPSVVDDGLGRGALVQEPQIHVVTVVPESPAARADVRSGDILASIDGLVFERSEDARGYLSQNAVEGVTVTFERADGSFINADLRAEELKDVGLTGVRIGFVTTGFVSYPTSQAILQRIIATGRYTMEIVRALGGLLRDFVTAQPIGVELSGPVGIAVMTREVAAMGFVYLIQFAAVLSINLAIVNVLPFPALDGGRLLFLFIEAWRGRAVEAKVETFVHNLACPPFTTRPLCHVS